MSINYNTIALFHGLSRDWHLSVHPPPFQLSEAEALGKDHHTANSRALLAFISQGQILSLLFTVINAEINGTSRSIHSQKALSMLRYRLQQQSTRCLEALPLPC